MQIAIPIRASALPLVRTGPVRALVILGMIRFTSETVRVAPMIRIRSFRDMQRFM